MNVHLKGAADNAYKALKQLQELVDDATDNKNMLCYDSTEELLSDINAILINYQPLLACYCLKEHFDELCSKSIVKKTR